MAVSIVAHEVTQRRDAARALLRTPLLTAATDRDALALIRHHAAALKSSFATALGYILVVEPTFARLVKAPLPAATPVRPARRNSGGEFTARTYTYLALICAAVLAPDTGEQVLASALVEQLRADAATVGIDLDDSRTEKRHLVAALRQLIAWGVIEETDGNVSGWGERQEEALLTVHRQMLPHLLARPLAALDGPEALVTSSPDVTEQPRRSLRRKLVENPLVRREDLTDAERDVLSRERTDLTRTLDDLFGLVLEVRAEGALAYDPDRHLSDVEFPGPGKVKQAALLLVDELLRVHKPTAGKTAELHGRQVPGLLCPWPQVIRIVADLAARHEKMWGAEHVSDPSVLCRDAISVLTSLSLAETTEDGLVLHPAVARHRPNVQLAPSQTRAHERLEPDAPVAPSLFDLESP
ncbi:TIGR02678 family protein [Micromonospora sp. NPDC049048]|uniref:TIGR02678 family protein n=1 Tax=Micromonospora sp. NPDC049048 TaxID=3364263 RepID=UPI003714E2DB